MRIVDTNKEFSRDVTAAMMVSLNKGTATMLEVNSILMLKELNSILMLKELNYILMLKELNSILMLRFSFVLS